MKASLAEPLLPPSHTGSQPTWRWRDVALVAVVGVLGPLSAHVALPDTAVAGLNAAALLVLAIALAAVIEHLAHLVGDVHGSLISASLANVVEFALSLVALRQGMLRFVQVSLLGTVLTSCLLIPGLSFIIRGLSEPRDKLNKHQGAMMSMVLQLASMAYCVATAYNVTESHTHSSACAVYCDARSMLGVSRVVAFMLLACYAVMLVWSTTTHSYLIAKRRSRYKAPQAAADRSVATAPAAAPGVGMSGVGGVGGVVATVACVLVLTLWVVLCADALLGSLDGATHGIGLTRHFAALVLVPNVGGMDAIVTATSLAIKGHVDLALSFAVGTAIQILLGVLPLLVLVSWLVSKGRHRVSLPSDVLHPAPPAVAAEGSASLLCTLLDEAWLSLAR